MRGIRAWALLTAALAVPSAAAGDEVKLVNGLLYARVRVIAAADGSLTFRLPNRVTRTVTLDEVASVTLDGQRRFNAAENLLAADRYARAAGAYRLAARGAEGWKKDLARSRLLKCLELSGQIDEAVKVWLALADAADGAKGVLALRPKRLAPPKDPRNTRAIAALKGRKVAPAAYDRAIKRLLADLYEQQGRAAEAAALRATLTGGKATTRAGDRRPRTSTEPPGQAAAQLKKAELDLRLGSYDLVARGIEARLTRYGSKDLPRALYLLGKAQLAMSRQGKDKAVARELLLAAGLNFMRVAVLFERSGEAPSALLAAAEVNRRLGNLPAARNACREVIRLFPTSSVVGAARAALETIEKTE